MVAQIKKSKKLSPFIFEFCFWEDPPHPVNWSPTHLTGPQTPFFYIYLCISRSNQTILKNKVHFFLQILLLGGPSPPSQLKLLNFFYLIVNFMMMPECNSLQSLMGKYTKNNLCEILLSGEKPHIPDKYQHIIVKQVHFLCSPKIYLQNQKTVF